MPGPLPKPVSIRSRGQRRARALSETPQLVPELPPVRDWHPRAIEWWQAVWTSPMATQYLAADVQMLVMAAVLVDAFYRSPKPSLAAEIRAWSREYGLSPLNRRRLEWAVEKAQPKPEAVPAPIRRPDPRLRLGRALPEGLK